MSGGWGNGGKPGAVCEATKRRESFLAQLKASAGPPAPSPSRFLGRLRLRLRRGSLPRPTPTRLSPDPAPSPALPPFPPLIDDHFREKFLWARQPMLAACAARLTDRGDLVWVDLGGGTGVSRGTGSGPCGAPSRSPRTCLYQI